MKRVTSTSVALLVAGAVIYFPAMAFANQPAEAMVSSCNFTKLTIEQSTSPAPCYFCVLPSTPDPQRAMSTAGSRYGSKTYLAGGEADCWMNNGKKINDMSVSGAFKLDATSSCAIARYHGDIQLHSPESGPIQFGPTSLQLNSAVLTFGEGAESYTDFVADAVGVTGVEEASKVRAIRMETHSGFDGFLYAHKTRTSNDATGTIMEESGQGTLCQHFYSIEAAGAIDALGTSNPYGRTYEGNLSTHQASVLDDPGTEAHDVAGQLTANRSEQVLRYIAEIFEAAPLLSKITGLSRVLLPALPTYSVTVTYRPDPLQSATRQVQAEGIIGIPTIVPIAPNSGPEAIKVTVTTPLAEDTMHDFGVVLNDDSDRVDGAESYRMLIERTRHGCTRLEATVRIKASDPNSRADVSSNQGSVSVEALANNNGFPYAMDLRFVTGKTITDAKSLSHTIIDIASSNECAAESFLVKAELENKNSVVNSSVEMAGNDYFRLEAKNNEEQQRDDYSIRKYATGKSVVIESLTDTSLSRLELSGIPSRADLCVQDGSAGCTYRESKRFVDQSLRLDASSALVVNFIEKARVSSDATTFSTIQEMEFSGRHLSADLYFHGSADVINPATKAGLRTHLYLHTNNHPIAGRYEQFEENLKITIPSSLRSNHRELEIYKERETNGTILPYYKIVAYRRGSIFCPTGFNVDKEGFPGALERVVIDLICGT